MFQKRLKRRYPLKVHEIILKYNIALDLFF